jgi:hypothetical protein
MAVRFILQAVSRTHGQFEAPFRRQPGRHLRRDFLYISFVFNGSIEAITEAIHRWFHFSSTACCTTRIYAFGTPSAYLRGRCTPEALTNQGGRTHQYIDHVVCFNTRESHHPNKHTILHVFRARGYDSIVPLSWYKHL